MEHSKQVDAVKKVIDLEILIANTQSKLSDMVAESYPPQPNPPVCETIERTYPKIEPQTKFNWKMAFIPAACLIIVFPAPIVWLLIYYFILYKKKRDEEIAQIENSQEYKAQCAALDREFEERQQAANQKYEVDKQVYETETLPNYRKAYAEWTAEHNREVDAVEAELKQAEAALNELYTTTKIVPLQYRSIEVLQYIYDMISSSDYDVRAAIENYEKQEQKRLELAKLQEQQAANQLAYEQNELLDQQNDIAKKARRDANIASVVGTVQRHNTNKTLKGFTKK